MTTILISLLSFLALPTISQASMRSCMLLPILNEDGGRENFQLFENVEKYMKNSHWCTYRSNAEILDILEGHKKNLRESLKSTEVLKLVAEKTRSGSLVKIEINNRVQGKQVKLQVVGRTGEDIYFSKERDIPGGDIHASAQIIKEWLSTYAEQIPYDGQVIGVLGDQFSVDTGKDYGLLEGDEVAIKRVVAKKRHPLLKEVVDWETRIVATGNIFHSAQRQSQGKARDYQSQEKIQVGDWVSITKKKQVSQDSGNFYGENDYQFGKLGLLQTSLHLGSGSVRSNTAGGKTNRIGGLVFGGDFKFELWATRNFFINFSYAKGYGNYKKKEGDIRDNSLDESSVTTTIGYKYLPLGFFYGPQVDTYMGYGKRTYGLDTQRSGDHGFTEFSFSGFLMGLKGGMPLVKDFRVFIQLDLIFSPGFEEGTKIYGEKDSSSHTALALGVDYAYSNALGINGEIGMVNSNADFKDPTREVKIQRSFLKIGVSYHF